MRVFIVCQKPGALHLPVTSVLLTRKDAHAPAPLELLLKDGFGEGVDQP